MSKFDQRTEESKKWRKLYGTAQWIKGRAWFLRNNPLCVFCEEEGRAEPATVVDHIKPHKGDKTLFYDVSNWQGLCAPHHDKTKQAMEKNEERIATGIDGWPIN